MCALKLFAILFGLAFVTVGVMGFLPEYTPNGNLFGLFEVDPMHNIIHIASGVVALIAASCAHFAKAYFILFGLIYGAVAIIGFIQDGDIYGYMHVNQADNYLHLGIAIVSLILGFALKAKKKKMGG